MKKQLQIGVKDIIEFGLELGYFIKEDNQIYINGDCDMSYNDFNDSYKNYIIKDNSRR